MDSRGNERVRLEGGAGNRRPCILFKNARHKPFIAFCALEEGTALLDLRGPKEQLLWAEPAQSMAALVCGPPTAAGKTSQYSMKGH